MAIVQTLFWISIFLLFYTYVVYPAGMLVVMRFIPPPSVSDLPGGNALPSVAVLVAGFNEEAHIGARIVNILEQDYPPELLRIYVGSDGSSDHTIEIARSFESERVVVRNFEVRRGKAMVLNDLAALATEDILVLSDANTLFERNAVQALVGPLQEDSVGAVCGELHLVDPGGRNPDRMYWMIEQTLKRAESRIGGLLGANGGIYALRREIYEPLPEDTIIDDFVIVMRIATRGYKVVYQPAARASEESPPTVHNEFRRRVRIGIGNYQTLFRYPEFLFKTRSALKFTYASHKVLRWLAPHLMLLTLLSTAALSHLPLYRWLFLGQVAGYILAFITYILDKKSKLSVPRIARMPLFLVAMNAALMVGFWRWMLGKNGGAWTPTPRA